jgi:hypothetical protein
MDLFRVMVVCDDRTHGHWIVSTESHLAVQIALGRHTKTCGKGVLFTNVKVKR